nr:hypothetical protein [Nonomuraea sp. SYSU D8015]
MLQSRPLTCSMPSARARSTYASRKNSQARVTARRGRVAGTERLPVITSRDTPLSRMATMRLLAMRLPPTAAITASWPCTALRTASKSCASP